MNGVFYSEIDEAAPDIPNFCLVDNNNKGWWFSLAEDAEEMNLDLPKPFGDWEDGKDRVVDCTHLMPFNLWRF